MESFEKFLLNEKLISVEALTAARRGNQAESESFLQMLRRADLLKGRELAEALSRYSGCPLVSHEDWSRTPTCGHELSLPFLRTHRVFPLELTPEGIVLAMEDPTDLYAIHAVRLALGCNVLPHVAIAEDIELAVQRRSRSSDSYANGAEPADPNDTGIQLTAQEQPEEDVENLRDFALETPVVQLANDLLQNAVYARATDIHIEPFDGKLKIRLRIDGILREEQPPPFELRKALVSRLKILSGLDIAERRLPQDGRARLRIGGRQIDLRVATMPTIHGEAMAIRILENVRRGLDFGKLGFSGRNRALIEQQLQSPHGMIIVTGPTGCGKTTTLATALSVLNNSQRKILTIEDPIEYELEGVNQTQAKPLIGLTFAHALRSFLRQDPDVIMIGEMRDTETATIGVHAALTGHLVLTTLHTNSACAAVSRLLDMGIDSYLLASSLRSVVGQRLVRLLCKSCRQKDDRPIALDDHMARAVFDMTGTTKPTFWRSVGCERCFGSGYADRTLISETLTIDADTRALISPHHAASDIEAVSLQNGMVPMWRDGLQKCVDGLTTLDEVRRVVTDV